MINGNFYKRIEITNLDFTKQNPVLLPLVKVELKPDATDDESIKRSIYADRMTQRLFNVCFPLNTYSSTVHIHEMEATAKIESVVNAFGGTRDSLYSVFYTVLPQADDWKKENKLLQQKQEDALFEFYLAALRAAVPDYMRPTYKGDNR